MNVLALALLALSAASPSPPGAGFVYLSAEADDFSPGGGGGAGGVLWTRALSPTLTADAGVFAYSLDGTSWAYGRIGARVAASRRTVLHAEANLGGGRANGEPIDYRVLRGGASFEAVERRVWAELETRYVEFGESRGNILKLGGAFLVGPSLVGHAAYHVSTGGNLGAQFWTVGGDLQRRLGLFAGLSVGRSRPEILRLFTTGSVVDSTEMYGGVRVPMGPHELTAYLDAVFVEGTRRTGLVLSLKLKL